MVIWSVKPKLDRASYMLTDAAKLDRASHMLTDAAKLGTCQAVVTQKSLRRELRALQTCKAEATAVSGQPFASCESIAKELSCIVKDCADLRRSDNSSTSQF